MSNELAERLEEAARKVWSSDARDLYLEAAQALREAGSGEPHWTKTKPCAAGVYGIRGWQFGVPKAAQFEAVVLVREFEGEFVCNLHEDTSSDRLDDWPRLDELSDKFEWCRFQYAPTPDQEPTQ